MKLNALKLFFAVAGFALFAASTTVIAQQRPAATAQTVEDLLAKMTLEEKAGQLNQYSGYKVVTGALDQSSRTLQNSMYARGMVGSVLNVLGVEDALAAQKQAVEETRLGIPLIFAFDVIHGYRTVFPVPLAESSSWDLEAMERSARVAAIEAAAAGQQWTFAPMVDIYRDPRWGRVMEGAGEDVYLGSLIAKARIKGFQGDDLGRSDTILACAKHFAGYGAVQAGRDYNTVDISDRTLWETYLPPFKASVDAGVRTFMNAFNEVGGVPSSGNSYLLRDILRGNWEFDGVVVSDWGSFFGMVNFGVVPDEAGAAELALEAGSDIDMESNIFVQHLPKLVRDDKISEDILDQAVRRVLLLKLELGLLDDPYRYLDADREKRMLLAPEHLEAARDMARKSIVLLKNDKQNDKQLLPLPKTGQTIAVIGPLADNQEHMNGFWKGDGRTEDAISLLTGIKAKLPASTKVLYAEGSGLEVSDSRKLKKAIKLAKKADVVILAVGEDSLKTGEASSRTNLDLYPAQLELAKAIHATGTPVVMVLMSGRPLTINWSAENIPAILEGWFLGSQAGNALADVLFGDYNPAGKLTMTFPRAVGQIPIHYDQKRISRPLIPTDRYTSKYIDMPNEPLYPFGYGLSYTQFAYSDIKLNHTSIALGQTLTATVTVTNTGGYAGEEVVQMYIQDMVGSVIRPYKELKGFEKIHLNPGESKDVTFEIGEEQLAFYGGNMTYRAEPGDFMAYIGTNSVELKQAAFSLASKL
ncbi:MAG: beta-glucosidase [Lentisphaeria bacterium]|jgi:beta-glucosidase